MYFALRLLQSVCIALASMCGARTFRTGKVESDTVGLAIFSILGLICFMDLAQIARAEEFAKRRPSEPAP